MSEPLQLVAWVADGDTAHNFVIIDHRGMVVMPQSPLTLSATITLPTLPPETPDE